MRNFGCFCGDVDMDETLRSELCGCLCGSVDWGGGGLPMWGTPRLRGALSGDRMGGGLSGWWHWYSGGLCGRRWWSRMLGCDCSGCLRNFCRACGRSGDGGDGGGGGSVRHWNTCRPGRSLCISCGHRKCCGARNLWRCSCCCGWCF